MTLTRVSDKSLTEMLASDEIDCAIIARPPDLLPQDHPDVVRLYPDYLGMEEEYYQRTQGVADHAHDRHAAHVLEANPWIARNLYNAFLDLKRRGSSALSDPAVSRYPLPWLTAYARSMRDAFGGVLFPFGIDENRPTLEVQLALYTYQQGIAHKHVKVDDMFPPGVMTKVIV